ncbi:MAG: hypothetical protein IJN28_05250 [Selenomonadales bacterium]|nr:hypothetical protein [Selenomonadales bacterium]
MLERKYYSVTNPLGQEYLYVTEEGRRIPLWADQHKTEISYEEAHQKFHNECIYTVFDTKNLNCAGSIRCTEHPDIFDDVIAGNWFPTPKL